MGSKGIFADMLTSQLPIILFCSTSLPLASTRWVLSTINQFMHSPHTKQCTAVDKSLLHQKIFEKILKMPIYWFDKPENNCGILSTRLGTDCQTINGMATTYIYIMIQSLTTLVAGVVLALIYEWRTALVSIAAMPLVMLAGFIRSKFRSGLM